VLRRRVAFAIVAGVLVQASVAGGGPHLAVAGPRAGSDCGSKVPAEAQRVFDDLVTAYRAGSARGIVALMERGKDARILLSLLDVPRATYASSQALGVLENTYFKRHTVTSLTETKDCPKGEGASFARSYLLTTRNDSTETSESLAVRVHRIDVDRTTSYWVLESIESTLIPKK